jgi:hemolysin D
MKSAEPSTKVDPSARKVIPLPRAARRDRHVLAFLPAALEIVETPPSPI